LDMVTGADVSKTVQLLKDQASSPPPAWVSTAVIAGDQSYDGVESWPVYLLSLYRSADLAVFRLKPATTKEKGNPPHSVNWNDLASIYAHGTPKKADPVRQDDSILYKNLFAVYYPCSALTVEQTSMSQDRKQNAEAAGIHDAWRWLCMERQKSHNQRQPVDYSDTFKPLTRSVAFGKIETPDHLNLGQQATSNLAHGRQCSIAGYWGCSGGMVCQFKLNEGILEVKVIGLFRGESVKQNYNEIVVFTPAGLNELQHSALDKEGLLLD